MTADSPDPVIEQAAIDVARGLQDTSKGEELNRAYRKLKKPELPDSLPSVKTEKI